MLRLLVCMWLLLFGSVGGLVLLMGGFLSERKDDGSTLKLGNIPSSYARRPKWESDTEPLPQIIHTLPAENAPAAFPDPNSQSASEAADIEADAAAVAVPTEASAPKPHRPRSVKRRVTAAEAKVGVDEKKWKQRPGRKRFGRFSGRRFFR